MAVNFYEVIGVHPSIGFKKTSKVTVDTAQFGDGYTQRTVSGINTTGNDFQISFRNQDIPRATKIIQFLETAGTKDFGTGASASVSIFDTAVTEVPVLSSGSNYYIAPTVTISGDGVGAQAIANIWEGQVTSISVTSGGSGYTTATATITTAPGSKTRAGVDYFLWTPPDAVETYKVVCGEWDEEYASSISRTINAKFVRVYDI